MRPRSKLLLSGFFIFMVGGLSSLPPRAGAQAPLWREGEAGSDDELDRLSRAVARLAEKVQPAVLQVRVRLQATAEAQGESPRPANSRGSGFIIHPEGYLLTAQHVVEGAREIEVRLADRRRLRAEIVAADPQVDVALLKILG